MDIGNQQTEMLAMKQQLVTGQPPTSEEEERVQPAENTTLEVNLQLQMLQILDAMQAAQN